jgi:hypothetical protein
VLQPDAGVDHGNNPLQVAKYQAKRATKVAVSRWVRGLLHEQFIAMTVVIARCILNVAAT